MTPLYVITTKLGTSVMIVSREQMIPIDIQVIWSKTKVKLMVLIIIRPL